MKNLRNQKDPGETFSSLAPLVLAAIVTVILVIVFAGWMSNFDRKMNFDQVTRKYILKMETTGGLTAEDESDLLAELAPYAKNIELEYDGKKTTRKGEAQYGDDIDLYIKADLYTYKFNITNGKEEGTVWQLENEGGEVDDNGAGEAAAGTEHTTTIKVHRSSTSKH